MRYFLTLAWSNRQLNKQHFYFSLRFSCICLKGPCLRRKVVIKKSRFRIPEILLVLVIRNLEGQGPVPERPISINPGLKFCSVFVFYIPMHCLG